MWGHKGEGAITLYPTLDVFQYLVAYKGLCIDKGGGIRLEENDRPACKKSAGSEISGEWEATLLKHNFRDLSI
jgi:hypothetical protein